MSEIPVVRVMPSHPSQGAFVEINESDFDATRHVRYVEPPAAPVLPPPPPPPPGPPNPLANLPKAWRNEKTSWLRDLAASINDGRTPETKEQAVQVIEAALAARK